MRFSCFCICSFFLFFFTHLCWLDEVEIFHFIILHILRGISHIVIFFGIFLSLSLELHIRLQLFLVEHVLEIFWNFYAIKVVTAWFAVWFWCALLRYWCLCIFLVLYWLLWFLDDLSHFTSRKILRNALWHFILFLISYFWVCWSIFGPFLRIFSWCLILSSLVLCQSHILLKNQLRFF